MQAISLTEPVPPNKVQTNEGHQGDETTGDTAPWWVRRVCVCVQRKLERKERGKSEEKSTIEREQTGWKLRRNRWKYCIWWAEAFIHAALKATAQLPSLSSGCVISEGRAVMKSCTNHFFILTMGPITVWKVLLVKTDPQKSGAVTENYTTKQNTSINKRQTWKVKCFTLFCTGQGLVMAEMSHAVINIDLKEGDTMTCVHLNRRTDKKLYHIIK